MNSLSSAPTRFAPLRASATNVSGMAPSAPPGLAIIFFWLVVTLAGPLSPHEASAMVDQDVFGGISRQFPLGTDYLGRDMLSRVLYGEEAR